MDCGDSNCCEHPACRESIMCVYFADPVDVLLRSVSIRAANDPSVFIITDALILLLVKSAN